MGALQGLRTPVRLSEWFALRTPYVARLLLTVQPVAEVRGRSPVASAVSGGRLVVPVAPASGHRRSKPRARSHSLTVAE